MRSLLVLICHHRSTSSITIQSTLWIKTAAAAIGFSFFLPPPFPISLLKFRFVFVLFFCFLWEKLCWGVPAVFWFSFFGDGQEKAKANGTNRQDHPSWLKNTTTTAAEREREEKWFSCIIDEASWRSRKTNFNQNQIVPPCLSRYVDGESSAPHVGSARLYGDSLLLPAP